MGQGLSPILQMGKLRSREGRDFPLGSLASQAPAFPQGLPTLFLEAISTSKNGHSTQGHPPPGKRGKNL